MQHARRARPRDNTHGGELEEGESLRLRHSRREVDVPLFVRVSAVVAAAGIALGTAWCGATAQTPISNTREVRDALRACWLILGSGASEQVSVRVAFNRDGEVMGEPLITYEASERTPEAVRDTLRQALARCTPLPLSDAFRKVISVRPITVRLGEGWKRRSQNPIKPVGMI